MVTSSKSETALDRQAGDDLPAVGGPAADEGVMLRSQENLQVTTERVPVSRVRVRKRIVTQLETITVEVSREELVIDEEPVTEADGDGAAPETAQEQAFEMVLYAERPVVTMETLAVERIRVSTRTVTEEEVITARIGKEQIEMHQDDPEVPARRRDPGTLAD